MVGVFVEWLGGYVRKRKKKNKPRLRKTFHTQEEFDRLCDDYNNKCVFCGRCRTNFTRDHIIPTSKGGSDFIWNIQPACEQCNWDKGSTTVDRRPFIPEWVRKKKREYDRKKRK